jgi:hypothetical protein
MLDFNSPSFRRATDPPARRQPAAATADIRRQTVAARMVQFFTEEPT